MRFHPFPIALVLALAACTNPAPPAAEPADVADAAPAMPPDEHPDADAPGPAVPPPTPPEFDPAPWSGAKLAAADVPPFYLRQWQRAENRATCAPVAPMDLGDGAGAVPRAATFSGGWAVAYDMPGRRSAFGVAGAGVTVDGDLYDGWENAIAWADGSHAGYGLEGGTGPGHLAYLQIAGQGCLYNVWSQLGEAHLVHLLESLRLVDVPAAAP